MAKEIEAKIKVADLEAVRTRLLQLGAVDEGVSFERNWVLDNETNSLRSGGVLLRVRSHGDVGGILTVKRKAEGGAFKTREEVESMVDSTDDLLQQLEMVGFTIRWIYEKRRRTMVWHDCVLALDELPEIGSYIEIEGSPKHIREVIAQLGLSPDDHIDDNYLGLWQKHLDSRGEPPRHMTFAHQQ